MLRIFLDCCSLSFFQKLFKLLAFDVSFVYARPNILSEYSNSTALKEERKSCGPFHPKTSKFRIGS